MGSMTAVFSIVLESLLACACMDADSLLLCSYFDVKMYLIFRVRIYVKYCHLCFAGISCASLQGSLTQFCTHIYIQCSILFLILVSGRCWDSLRN